MLCFAIAIPNGVFGSWQAVLDVLLDPVGLDQVRTNIIIRKKEVIFQNDHRLRFLFVIEATSSL